MSPSEAIAEVFGLLSANYGWSRSERSDGAIVLEKRLSTGKEVAIVLLPPSWSPDHRRWLS